MRRSTLKKIDLHVIATATRHAYLDLQDQGVSLREMAVATGLPASTFSMWLSGYRPIVKVDVLQRCIDALGELEELTKGR